MRYHFIPSKMAVIKEIIGSVGEVTETGGPSHRLLELEHSEAALEGSSAVPKKLKHRVTI